jgi:hypothetical protein
VWPFRPINESTTDGGTLLDRDYRDWVLDMQKRGVEIALHGIADGSSDRPRISAGLDYFRSVIGSGPTIHTNHVRQAEGIYWGPRRLDAPLLNFYRAYRSVRGALQYDGASSGSPYFWGDLCRSQIKYVRNFVFNDVNTLKADPLMPYHDVKRPYVNFWFSASNGAGPEAFCRLISEENQDRLASEGGACVVYTHFALGFNPVPAEFRRLIERLARTRGWFVPATELLEHVGAQRGWCRADRAPLLQMQWRWALERGLQTADQFGAMPSFVLRGRPAHDRMDAAAPRPLR